MRKTKVVKLKGQRWHVRKRLSLIRNSSWKADAHVGNTMSCQWKTPHVHLSKSVQTSYDVHRPVFVSGSTNWDNKQSVQQQGQALHHTQQHVGVSANIKFNTRSVVGVEYNVEFNVRTSLSLAAPLSHHTKQQIVKQRVVNWQAFELPCTISAGWSVRNSVNVDKCAEWCVASPVNVLSSSKWNVYHTGICATTSWKNKSSVCASRKVVFNARLTIGKKRAILWKDYHTLWLGRVVRYKVFRPLSAFAIPKGVHRPGKHRGAYIPNMTANSLSKNRRVKLEI